jgi:hypothetical protein
LVPQSRTLNLNARRSALSLTAKAARRNRDSVRAHKHAHIVGK